MAINMIYTNPRKTHLQVQLTTPADTLGPLTGPVNTTIAADGSYPTYQAIVAGGGGGVPAIVFPWANQLPGVPPTVMKNAQPEEKVHGRHIHRH